MWNLLLKAHINNYSFANFASLPKNLLKSSTTNYKNEAPVVFGPVRGDK
jgi:hypothetical protein